MQAPESLPLRGRVDLQAGRVTICCAQNPGQQLQNKGPRRDIYDLWFRAESGVQSLGFGELASETEAVGITLNP